MRKNFDVSLGGKLKKDNYRTGVEMRGSRKEHVAFSASEGIGCFTGSTYDLRTFCIFGLKLGNLTSCIC